MYDIEINFRAVELRFRPRAIYQYSNMAPGFHDKHLYLELFSLYLSLFWELRDKSNLNNLQFWPESLGTILEYLYIWLWCSVKNIIYSTLFMQRTY